jgi:hypothetical protein
MVSRRALHSILVLLVSDDDSTFLLTVLLDLGYRVGLGQGGRCGSSDAVAWTVIAWLQLAPS